MKKCNRCLNDLDLKYFHKKKISNDGHNNVCKECKKQINNKFYKNNKDSKLKYQKEYRELNKERVDSYKKEYNKLLSIGVAPEQARIILPQNMMTSWYWTGSLMFFHRVFKQRTDLHAQLETQEVAHAIGEICNKLFPVSWTALNA